MTTSINILTPCMNAIIKDLMLLFKFLIVSCHVCSKAYVTRNTDDSNFDAFGHGFESWKCYIVYLHFLDMFHLWKRSLFIFFNEDCHTCDCANRQAKTIKRCHINTVKFPKNPNTMLLAKSSTWDAWAEISAIYCLSPKVSDWGIENT